MFPRGSRKAFASAVAARFTVPDGHKFIDDRLASPKTSHCPLLVLLPVVFAPHDGGSKTVIGR
jgi:hypothetical protein